MCHKKKSGNERGNISPVHAGFERWKTIIIQREADPHEHLEPGG